MKRQPFFSIVIATYNRQAQLASCLEALTRLRYPCDRFEAIVVNDGGAAPDAVAASFADHMDLKLLHQRHAGSGAARNTGTAAARGEFLAFTDDDCAPDAGWLAALARRFSATPDHLIGGRTLNALPHNVFSTASQLLVTYLYSYYNSDPENARFFTTNNMALPTHHFHEIGGFDAAYTRIAAEDRDLCDRWLYHGYRMSYAPPAIVHHAHTLTFRAYWRQHFNYGRGAFQFRQARAHRDQEPVKLEPPSFYTNLVRYAFVGSDGRHTLPLATLLMLSQAANAAGFFWERFSQSQNRESQT